MSNDNFCEVQATLPVTNQDIQFLLSSALEGGSNYWYYILSSKEPSDESLRTDKESPLYNCIFGDGYIEFCEQEEFYSVNGDKSQLTDTWKLDSNGIKNGLKIMAEKHTEHFQDFISEEYDGITGDVFLQLCLFGKLIYG